MEPSIQPSAGDFSKALDASNQPVPSDDANKSEKLGSAVFGNISLDLSYSQAESLSRQVTMQDSSGSVTTREDYFRSFSSSLSLDFSFMARYNGAADKLSQLDSSVFSDWNAAAGDLMSFNPKDYEEFVTATDQLFNEIEKVMGMGPTGLDHVAQFFSQEVKGFIDGVQGKLDYFKQNPLGEGANKGLDIPGLFNAANDAIPGDLQKFIEDTMPKLPDNGQDSPENESLRRLRDIFAQLLEKLKNPEQALFGKGDEENKTEDASEPAEETAVAPPPPPPPPPSGDTGGDMLMKELLIRYSYMRQESFSITSLYNAPQDEAAKNPEQKALDTSV
ncbi:MAG: hypothetical protein HY751_09565 [Nitrospinae bacterium]|nr:hypothetical protein [Nitrospinota bacterium]